MTICKMCDAEVPKWRKDSLYCCECCRAVDAVNNLVGKQVYSLKGKGKR